MKKVCTLLTLVILVSTAGCGSEEGKVHVIEGPGKANSSLMVSFNEVCEGGVEGFLGNTGHLLVSQREAGQHSFYNVNTASKEKSPVFSTSLEEEPYVEISPDGTQFLYNHIVIDVEKGSKTFLNPVDKSRFEKPEGLPFPASYTFLDTGEAVLVDPFHYLQKYYMGGLQSFNPDLRKDFSSIPIIPVGDQSMNPKTNPSMFNFKGIDAPKLRFIKEPKLILSQLKYIFLGIGEDTQAPSLYMLDMFQRKFEVVDTGVKSFYVSPDQKTLAYVKKGKEAQDDLYLYAMAGETKEKIVSMYKISGVTWSPDSQRIAYAASEKSSSDLWLVHVDGKEKEQLTHGMNARGNPSWSSEGNQIAFTVEQGDSSKVYMITLNVAVSGENQKEVVVDPEREEMAKQMKQLLQYETALQKKKSKS